jgi:hypothetical protein
MTRLRQPRVWLSIWLGLGTGCALQYVVPDDDDGDDTDGPECETDDCMQPEPCTLDACGDECVDLDSDPANCGTCGRWCESSAECIDGACVTTCSDSCDSDAEICTSGVCECRAGLMRCDDECVDIASDDDNCGMCGRECEDMLCNAGECAAACSDVLDACEDACVDLSSDPLNCGACERDCHPSQICTDGECKSPE